MTLSTFARNLCRECGQDAYPGIHGTGCTRAKLGDSGIPTALLNQVLHPPLTPCEWCRLHTPSSEFWAQLGHRPVGEACQVCGNDAPEGTYPLPARYTGQDWGDREPPVLVRNHIPPRAPAWTAPLQKAS